MTASAAARCDLTELLVEQCGHCTRQTNPPDLLNEAQIVSWFNARYGGPCGFCDVPIRPEEPIARTVDGDYVHARHASGAVVT